MSHNREEHTHTARTFSAGKTVKSSKPELALPMEKRDLWKALIYQACQLSISHVNDYAARLTHALFEKSESAFDGKEANLYFHGAQLLKSHVEAFLGASAHALEAVFINDVNLLYATEKPATGLPDVAMSLVSYEEMELKLSFSRASRSLELSNAEPLAALNMRLAQVLTWETLHGAQNPFRPESFLRAFHMAWCEVNTEKAAHDLILPLLSAHLFELAPLFFALNENLIARGVLPDLQESYRQKRKQSGLGAALGSVAKSEVSKKLEEYFNGAQESSGLASPSSMGAMGTIAESSMVGGAGTEPFDLVGESAVVNPANSELFAFLAQMQKNMAIQEWVAGTQNTARLSQLRHDIPASMHSGVERHTLELMAQVFDGVFGNHDIPDPIKNLIGMLQVPVLKAALIDRNFFFQDSHPARRLIDVLSKYGTALDPQKAESDPLFLAMQRNVLRVQKEFDHQLDLFGEVVTDLEEFVKKEEQANLDALQAPIQRALQKEKFKQASIAATNEISLRVGSGEVLTFVETFLENRWTKVLTLAYSVKDEKPHAVADAIKTMDDLIWSIKPKITLAQRQEMINRLPGILARLNKWLSLIKWEDADRVQFFADLAECHASIVRAPLELSPERQMEIAVEAAKIATERRLEKRAKIEAIAKEKAKQDATEKERLVALAIERAKSRVKQVAAQRTNKNLESAQSSTPASAPAPAPALAPSQVASAPSPVLELPNEAALPAALMPEHMASPALQLDDSSASIQLQSLVEPGLDLQSIAQEVEREIEASAERVASLERGIWVEFLQRDRSLKKVRLAWVSPMRSLYIFTSSEKEKSFSISADDLEKSFRDQAARIISLDKVVDRALIAAMENTEKKKVKKLESA